LAALEEVEGLEALLLAGAGLLTEPLSQTFDTLVNFR
jgi:hypothetical protein